MQIKKNTYNAMRWFSFWMALSSVFILGGCESGRERQPPSSRPMPEVSTVTARPQRVVLNSVLPGRTSAFRFAEIRPQVSGLIQKRLFTEGSTVQADQVLYQIDPAPFQAALDNARAALSRTEAGLPALKARVKRYEELLADKAVSRHDYDDADAALTQVEADIRYYKATVETTRINLGYTRITAPIAGRIGRSNVTEGAIVTAFQPVVLATIQQLDPVYVDVPQSTTDLLRLKNNGLNDGEANRNKVKLILEDNTAYPLEGTLQFSDITVDPTTGSVILRVIFPNPEGVLLPGMFVRAVIKEGIHKQGILIPQQGVSRDPKGNPYALIVDTENKVGVRMLTLDRAISDKWLVSAGLAPGERVIVEGTLMLRPGTVVKASPFEKAPDGNDPMADPHDPHQKQRKGGA